jgi:hypothetical protein
MNDSMMFFSFSKVDFFFLLLLACYNLELIVLDHSIASSTFFPGPFIGGTASNMWLKIITS